MLTIKKNYIFTLLKYNYFEFLLYYIGQYNQFDRLWVKNEEKREGESMKILLLKIKK